MSQRLNLNNLHQKLGNVIQRFIKRVIERNKSHQVIQFKLSETLVSNESSIMGNHLKDLPIEYIYFKKVNHHTYFYDVRELNHMFNTSNLCPYTRVPFSKYEKYFILRKYFLCRSTENFEDIYMKKLSYKDSNACLSKINSLLDEYNSFDISTIESNQLLSLIPSILQWQCRIDLSLINQAIYHYHNLNDVNFRSCMYLILSKIIENSSDRYLTANHILNLLVNLVTPSSLERRALDILDMVDIYSGNNSY